MSELRDLLRGVSKKDDKYSRYVLFEALVQAVEPKDTNATIRKLREELEAKARDSRWEAVAKKMERKHDEAKAETEGLRTRLTQERAVALADIRRICKERDEARAEIERLRPLAENWQLVLGLRNDWEAS